MFSDWRPLLYYLGQAVVTIVWPLHAIVLHHTIIKGSLETKVTRFTKTLNNIRSREEVVPHLGVSAVRELHVGAAPLQAGGVGHELRGAHGLHLPEEVHGAAGDVLALLQTFPEIALMSPGQR